MKKRIATVILLLFVISKFLPAQDNFGISIPFLTYHFRNDDQAFLQPNRLDKNARFVLNYGIIAYYERYIYKNSLSVKIAQAAYSDCASLFGGFSHIALRYKFISTSRHALRAGFGPTFVYRQSWYRFPEYMPTKEYFARHGDWQYAFSPFAGEIEYDFKLNDKASISLNVIPAIPDLLFFSAGFRYWFRPIPQNAYWKANPEKRKWFYRNRDLD